MGHLNLLVAHEAAFNVGGPGRVGRSLLENKKITVCPRSSDPFYMLTYYIKWVTTSGHSVSLHRTKNPLNSAKLERALKTALDDWIY